MVAIEQQALGVLHVGDYISQVVVTDVRSVECDVFEADRSHDVIMPLALDSSDGILGPGCGVPAAICYSASQNLLISPGTGISFRSANSIQFNMG